MGSPSRLSDARAARQEADRLRKDLADARKRSEDAECQLNSATAQLRPLFDVADVTDAAALQPFVERSDRKRAALAAVEEARKRLVAAGDGLPFAVLAEEVDAEELDTVTARLRETTQDLEHSRAAESSRATELLEAEHAVNAIAGQANAAVAEAKRQEALAAMGDAAERYVRVSVATHLLRWSIDRYRERKQGPMLARASVIFASLTLGGFQRLVVDYEGESPVLAALRQSGAPLDVTGMSEGTRDQLYLALRLAALELHLDQSSPLPFVADDLFVNFDDERSAAGLAALGFLSRRTQVIFLTHHAHLVPLYEKEMGGLASVTRL